MNATTGLAKKWVLSSAVAAMTFSIPFTMRSDAAPLKPKAVKINPAQVLRFGSYGKSVEMLQQILQKRSLYQNELDGIYGPDTQTAIMLYQQINGLKVDGVAGPKTLGSLLKKQGRSVPTDRILSIGDRGQSVRDVQNKLKELGYYNNTVDGLFGPGTKDAVKTFQAMNQLKIDGIVGPHTRKALFNLDSKSAVQSIKTSKDRQSQNQASEEVSSQQKDKAENESRKESKEKDTVQPVSYTTNGSDILSTAKSLIGTPYKWGGTTPSGFDCSGFVDYVFEQIHIQLPRTASSIWNYGVPIDHPQPGDLVFFETYKSGPSHVGIFVGNNKFIHADADKGIMISSMSLDYWKSRYFGAERIVQN
ncbi:MAG TPA: peptidoglycan-binding protein [Bacillales bacterium]|nr:peptidoglycan-binding protein [Bacillales bacterium]